MKKCIFIVLIVVFGVNTSWSSSTDHSKSQLTRDLFTIVLSSYQNEAYEHFTEKKFFVATKQEERVEHFNPDFYSQKYYYDALLAEWQNEIRKRKHSNSNDIIAEIFKNNGFLNRHNELWEALIYGNSRINLGYTRTKAFYEILKSEQIADPKERLLKILDITAQYLLANSKDYLSTNLITEILEKSNDPDVSQKARNIRGNIPATKRMHLFNQIKNFYAQGSALGVGSLVNALKVKTVASVSKTLAPYSYMQRAAFLSGAAHIGGVGAYYLWPEGEEEIAFSPGQSSFENISYYFKQASLFQNPDAFVFKKIKNYKSQTLRALSEVNESGLSYLSGKNESFNYFNFFTQLEAHKGLMGKREIELALDVARIGFDHSLEQVNQVLVPDDVDIESLRAVIMQGPLRVYRGNQVSLYSTHMGYGTNCVGRTMYFLSLLLDPQIKQVIQKKLGVSTYQDLYKSIKVLAFSDHLEPAIIIPNSKDGSKQLNALVKGSLFKARPRNAPAELSPAFLVWDILNKQKVDVDKDMSEFVVYKPKSSEFIPYGSWFPKKESLLKRARSFYSNAIKNRLSSNSEKSSIIRRKAFFTNLPTSGGDTPARSESFYSPSSGSSSWGAERFPKIQGEDGERDNQPLKIGPYIELKDGDSYGSEVVWKYGPQELKIHLSSPVRWEYQSHYRKLKGLARLQYLEGLIDQNLKDEFFKLEESVAIGEGVSNLKIETLSWNKSEIEHLMRAVKSYVEYKTAFEIINKNSIYSFEEIPLTGFVNRSKDFIYKGIKKFLDSGQISTLNQYISHYGEINKFITQNPKFIFDLVLKGYPRGKHESHWSEKLGALARLMRSWEYNYLYHPHFVQDSSFNGRGYDFVSDDFLSKLWSEVLVNKHLSADKVKDKGPFKIELPKVTEIGGFFIEGNDQVKDKKQVEFQENKDVNQIGYELLPSEILEFCFKYQSNFKLLEHPKVIAYLNKISEYTNNNSVAVYLEKKFKLASSTPFHRYIQRASTDQEKLVVDTFKKFKLFRSFYNEVMDLDLSED